MHIQWLMLAGAMLLLLIPACWIYPAAAKERLTTYHSARFRLERMLRTWQHWFDFIRAYAATYLLVNHAVLFDAATAEEPGERYLRLILIGSILVLAVVRQTVQHRQVFYFTAPIFYLWGVTLALMDPFPAIFAILFSALLARLLNHIEVKLPVMAGLLGVPAYLINGFSFELLLATALIMLPIVIAFASMNHLVCYTHDLV